MNNTQPNTNAQKTAGEIVCREKRNAYQRAYYRSNRKGVTVPVHVDKEVYQRLKTFCTAEDHVQKDVLSSFINWGLHVCMANNWFPLDKEWNDWSKEGLARLAKGNTCRKCRNKKKQQ